MIQTKEKHSSSIWSLSRILLISLCFGAVVIGVLLMVGAVVLLKTGQTNASITDAAVLVISAIGSIFAGVMVGRIVRKNGLILGSLMGFLLYFLMLVVGAACGALQLFTVSAGIRLAVMLLGGAFGGLASVNKRSKAK
jgi:putative membrane protein (TIGR04086 family)